MELLIPANLIENFHFLRPVWLLGLLPALVFIFSLWRVGCGVYGGGLGQVGVGPLALLAGDQHIIGRPL